MGCWRLDTTFPFSSARLAADFESLALQLQILNTRVMCREAEISLRGFDRSLELRHLGLLFDMMKAALMTHMTPTRAELDD